MIYNKDATERFLPSESVDLFVTHPPYFYTSREAYGNAEGQMQNTDDRKIFVERMIKAIKHMEYALKPNGTIVVGLPTDDNLYRIIEKINTETNLKYGPLFFWDYAKSPHVDEVTGIESNAFLNLHKGNQRTNTEYKIDSYTLVHPWVISDELKEKWHIAFVLDSAPEIVYERIIQRYSRPGDVVGDLFGGTGTVLKVAKALNRNFVYNDISESQVKLARIILEDEKEDPLDLKRKEVIELMTKEIQEMNRKLMIQHNMPNEQQEQYIKQSGDELNRVNGMLFDLLVKHGVIR